MVSTLLKERTTNRTALQGASLLARSPCKNRMQEIKTLLKEHKEEIKKDVKEQVDLEEFEMLERRVSALEAKAR